MSNLNSLINTLFPPVVRNVLRQLYRNFLDDVCMAQLYIYFALDDIPLLDWMCPVLECMDMWTRAFWWCIAYAFKIEVWILLNMARLYVKLLRYAICLFYGYSILVALANMDFSANIPMLEMILQNTEWIYQYAGQFIDFNVAIVEKAVENFCAVPFEQIFINDVKRFVDIVNQFINN